MWIEIEALDTLFFKDGKPFSMGEETWADGIFPPTPSVIYGALRTLYFSQMEQDINMANETGDLTKNLKIKNFFLYTNGEDLFPLPLDLVRIKNQQDKEKELEKRENRYTVYNLKLEPNHLKSSIPNLDYILAYEKPVENISDGYLPGTELIDYLSGYQSQFTARRMEHFVTIEAKVGIARNNYTRSSQEGKLYRVGMWRLKNVRIIVEFDGLEGIWDSGFLKLGGENKVAKYKITNSIVIKSPNSIRKKFKIYLSTPGLLRNGWLPEWIDARTFEGTYPGTEIKVKLISVAIGKPIQIGGFDMKERKPKKMLNAVPPGSVYYFEILGNIESENIKSIKPIQFCEYEERKNEGFGITYIGSVI